MIRYADGSEARPGDRVDCDGWPGVVEDVLDDAASLARWGLEPDEPGLMILTDVVGLVFQPTGLVDWDALVLLRRDEAAGDGPPALDGEGRRRPT